MTRSLGAGLAAGIAASTGERAQLVHLDFADSSNVPTPIYLTNAARDIVALGKTWVAAGGTLELDVLGESADDPATGPRIKLCGVLQDIIAQILAARWRGRLAHIWHIGIDPATGVILTDPKKMFSGPMNGGFSIVEARGEFGNGRVDISGRLTSRLGELAKIRGCRCNEASHRYTIPAAAAAVDSFMQHVPQLVMRKIWWGQRSPTDTRPNAGVYGAGGRVTEQRPNPPKGGGLVNPGGFPDGRQPGGPWGGRQPGQTG